MGLGTTLVIIAIIILILIVIIMVERKNGDGGSFLKKTWDSCCSKIKGKEWGI